MGFVYSNHIPEDAWNICSNYTSRKKKAIWVAFIVLDNIFIVTTDWFRENWWVYLWQNLNSFKKEHTCSFCTWLSVDLRYTYILRIYIAILLYISYIHCLIVQFSPSLSCVRLFVTPWTAACQASLSFTLSQSLLKLMSVELVMPSNHLILCHPLLLLPSIFPSIRVFFPVSWLTAIRWSFRFSIGLCSNLLLKGQQTYWIRARPQ